MKRNNPEWDVTMGSFDSAEVADLVSLFLLSRIEHLPVKSGIYKDDGICLSDLSADETENVRQEICRIFKTHGLGCKAEANKKVAHYLDVTLDLGKGEHRSYRKPNNIPVYVHAQSNHPPAVKKSLPIEVNRRLNVLNSNEAAFNFQAPMYQDALNKAGYKHQLKYEKVDVSQLNRARTPRNRRRREFWYNPPWDDRVSGCVIKRMFAALDECYPRGHPLRSLFNRHTVRAGYRTLANMKKLVTVHNTKRMKEHNDNILREQENANPPPPEPRRTRAQAAAAAAADLIPDVLLPAPAPPPGPVIVNPPRPPPGPAPTQTRPPPGPAPAPPLPQRQRVTSKQDKRNHLSEANFLFYE